ncbi:MAG: TolC family protein [Nannocystaceae bacterium]|nr:TolC family protein [Nannocystaceae bacterium]
MVRDVAATPRARRRTGGYALLGVGLLSGCYHAAPYSPAVAEAQWLSIGDTSFGAAPSPETDEESSTPVPVLTAEQTYTMAVAHSEAVVASAARAEVATAEVAASRQLENPQLRLTDLNVDEIRADETAMDIAVRVPIPRPGSIKTRVEGAKQLAQAQHSRTDDARRLLRAQVFKLHARLAMLAADRKYTEQATELRTARRDQVTARVESRVATNLDAALAEVSLAEAKRAQSAVDDDIAATNRALARLAGVSGPVRFSADPSQLSASGGALDHTALVARAIATRPELHAAHYRVNAALADVHLAKGEAWPWFEWAQVQYMAAPDATPSSLGFGVALTLPVFSWNRRKIRANKARVHQREAEQRAGIVAVATEVAAAVARVERTATVAADIERDLLPAVERARKEAEKALGAGALGPIEAGDIEARAVEAQRIHLAALLDHRDAMIDLEAAIGGPIHNTGPRDAP